MSQPTTQLPEWQRLSEHAAQLVQRPLADVVAGPGRFEDFSFVCDGLLIDLSKQRLTKPALRALCELGARLDLPTAVARLMDGAIVNPTEQRAALHTALRAPPAERPAAVRDEIDTELARMYAFADRLRRVHGAASPARRFATSCTSASAAPIWARNW